MLIREIQPECRITYSTFLQASTHCPFCGGKEKIILDSQHAFLTYARSPYHKHHLLVIPHRHIGQISELSSEEMSDIFSLQKVAIKVLKNLGYENISLLVRDGNTKNKSVFHTHFHVIPEVAVGDLDHYHTTRYVMTEEEIAETLRDIQKALI